MFENVVDIFLCGSGSGCLLYVIYECSVLGIVVRGGNGIWGILQFSYIWFDFGYEGWQEVVVFKGVFIFYCYWLDDIVVVVWYCDLQVVKEFVLKFFFVLIYVGGENVKVIFMGKFEEDQIFIDFWGWVWQFCIWYVMNVFVSEWLVEFDLLVFDGMVGFEVCLVFLFCGSQFVCMKFLVNFIVVFYEGKFLQWDEFLGQMLFLLKVFVQLVLYIEYGYCLVFDD